MKLRSTTPVSTSFLLRAAIVVVVAITAITLPIQFFANRPVSADELDAEIEAIQRKVQQYEDEAAALRKESDSLQNVLAQLSNDEKKIQSQITLYETQHDKLVQEIKDTETQIAENRETSGELIVTSTVSSDVPLVVRLAASDNLADYIEGEASLNSVRDTIVQKTEENEKLKAELVTKKDEVQKVLSSERIKREELNAKQAAQSQLLAETKGSEAKYKDMIQDSQAQIDKLKEDQRQRQLAAQQWGGGYITTGGSGGYPWANVGYPCWSAACVDPWGLYYRECVSYVAWKLSSTGKGVRGFGGAGHAKQWPSTTAGYTTQKRGTNPKAGDAVVIPAGVQGISWTGHIMYVESVNGDGSINVSEYNFDGTGTYSERNISPSMYSQYVFITFPSR